MTMLDTQARSRRPAPPEPRYLTRGAAAVALAPQPAPSTRPRRVERPSHLRVVAPAERVRRRLTPGAAVLLTAALFATLLAVAVAQTVLVQGQVRLDSLDAQLTQEQTRYQELRKTVAELESPVRIVGSAHQQGMVTPDDLIYLQPPAPEPSAVGPTTGDAPEPAADPTVGAALDRAWAEVKPMLEAPAP
jgi:cell division protein FtsL